MIRTQATTVSLCTSRPATRSYRTSMLFSSTVRAAGMGACQKRILGSVLQGSTALPRQCGSSRPPGSNSQPGSRAPGRNRPLCRRPPKIPHLPRSHSFIQTRVGLLTPVPTRNDGSVKPSFDHLIGNSEHSRAQGRYVTKISSQQFLATARADRFRRCYLRAQAETGNRNVGVSSFGHAAVHEAKLRHPHFFFHRNQDRRVFANDDGSPLNGQRCPLIEQHLIHHVDRARVLKREVPLPVLVAGVPDLFGGVADAVIRPPVLRVNFPHSRYSETPQIISLMEKLDLTPAFAQSISALIRMRVFFASSDLS